MQPTDRISKHFAAVELIAQTEPGPERDRKWAQRSPLATPAVLNALEALAADLEVIRAIAGKPIRITSGLRPGSGSQHNHGQAVDIQIDGMTPLALIALIWQHRERMPHRLRQVIAETLSADADGLDKPMGKGMGGWVHVAIVGLPSGPYAGAASKPWATHTAADGDGYPAWSPREVA
jgi:hypothetical protein